MILIKLLLSFFLFLLQKTCGGFALQSGVAIAACSAARAYLAFEQRRAAASILVFISENSTVLLSPPVPGLFLQLYAASAHRS